MKQMAFFKSSLPKFDFLVSIDSSCNSRGTLPFAEAIVQQLISSWPITFEKSIVFQILSPPNTQLLVGATSGKNCCTWTTCCNQGRLALESGRLEHQPNPKSPADCWVI